MSQTFREIVVGDVLVAPFVGFAALALVIVVALRFLLIRAGVGIPFDSMPLAKLAVYMMVLALLIAIA